MSADEEPPSPSPPSDEGDEGQASTAKQVADKIAELKAMGRLNKKCQQCGANESITQFGVSTLGLHLPTNRLLCPECTPNDDAAMFDDDGKTCECENSSASYYNYQCIGCTKVYRDPDMVKCAMLNCGRPCHAVPYCYDCDKKE